MIQKSMSLKYEPSSDPLHISGRPFRGRGRCRHPQPRSGARAGNSPPPTRPGLLFAPARVYLVLKRVREDLSDSWVSRFRGFLRGTSLGGVPREQKMLKGHLPRVIYHQVYLYTKINISSGAPPGISPPPRRPGRLSAPTGVPRS